MSIALDSLKYKTNCNQPLPSIRKKLALPQLALLRKKNFETENGFSMHSLIESSYEFDPSSYQLHPPNQSWIVWSSWGPRALGTFDFETKLSEKGNIPVPNTDLKGEISYFPYGMFPDKKSANEWLELFYEMNPNAIHWNIQVTDASQLPVPITLNKWQYDEKQWVKYYDETMKMNHEQIYKDSLKLRESKSDIIKQVKQTNEIVRKLFEEDTKIQKQNPQERFKKEEEHYNKLLSRKNIEIETHSKIDIPKSKTIKSLFPSLFDQYLDYDSLIQSSNHPYTYILLQSKENNKVYLARKYL